MRKYAQIGFRVLGLEATTNTLRKFCVGFPTHPEWVSPNFKAVVASDKRVTNSGNGRPLSPATRSNNFFAWSNKKIATGLAMTSAKDLAKVLLARKSSFLAGS